MKNKTPLIVIGIIVLAGIIGAVAYGMNQNKSDDMSTMDMSKDSSKSSSSDSMTAKDAVSTDSVAIENFDFTPATITVKKGTMVTWTNKDSVQHNVVGDDYNKLNGKLIAKGESFSFKFDEAGTYAYHCSPHPYMKGTVIVTE